MLESWAKRVCNNLEHCILSKPNIYMFTCGDSTDEYIQYAYECNDRLEGERTLITCEDEQAELSCETGNIHIVKAGFGRFNDTICSDVVSTQTFCNSPTAAEKMAMCEGETLCSFQVNSDNLGITEYCDTLPKYLLVDYVCQ
ncbi:L-rhamnose-binding lectin CSL3-like [Brachionichthys hirsutus]|uniref:L-rhamnose-binding lectin CSL3-like n=1 Tax=Brachionichthys hirsutus TaxID=412623 RepID=UPI00360534E5